MKAFRICKWNAVYENNRSREIVNAQWLPLPNKFDGAGFMELLDHPAGISHYGAWCLLLAAASRMPVRGLLIADSGRALTVRDIARMTRCFGGSTATFEEVIPRLISIKWLEETDVLSGQEEVAAKLAAGIPQDGAGKTPLEGEGELKRKEKGKEEPPPPIHVEAKAKAARASRAVAAIQAQLAKHGMPATQAAAEEWAPFLQEACRCLSVGDIEGAVAFFAKRGCKWQREAVAHVADWKCIRSFPP